MSFIKNYQKYIAIVVISSILGFVRWIFLDKEFPLIGLSKNQHKSLYYKQFSENPDLINYQNMQLIVEHKMFHIIDARDIESYEEGYIGDAINIDALLLIEDGDEDEINKLYNFIDSNPKELNINPNIRLILYCWNPDCHRAENLQGFLIGEDLVDKNIISIYSGGWDEWDSLYKLN